MLIDLAKVVIVISIILAAHTMAYHDEVDQELINSQSATYVNDNGGDNE